MNTKSCLLGAIIGDIAGSVYELQTNRTVTQEYDKPLFIESSDFTDDTICTCAVADWLCGAWDTCKDSMVYWCRMYTAGYGANFYKWVASHTHTPYDSFGNGSAMRVSPVGYIAKTEDEVLELAKTSAEFTHGHPDGISGAQVTAMVVFMAHNGYTKNDIREYLENKFSDYHIYNSVEEVISEQGYRFQINCKTTVEHALTAFFLSTDYESCIRIAMLLNLDTDTVGAIAGSMASAMYGVPQWMIDKVYSILDENVKEIIDRFDRKVLLNSKLI